MFFVALPGYQFKWNVILFKSSKHCVITAIKRYTGFPNNFLVSTSRDMLSGKQVSVLWQMERRTLFKEDEVSLYSYENIENLLVALKFQHFSLWMLKRIFLGGVWVGYDFRQHKQTKWERSFLNTLFWRRDKKTELKAQSKLKWCKYTIYSLYFMKCSLFEAFEA